MDATREAIEAIMALKRIPRKGWIEHGLPRDKIESVAAHAFGTAALLVVLNEAGALPASIDLEKALVIAVLHDLTESRTGDITPRDGIPPGKKQEMEHEAADGILDPVGPLARLNTILHEFIDATPRDRNEHGLVKRLDKLDMMLQATVYERELQVDLSGFHAIKEYLAGDGALERVLARFKKPRPDS